MVEWSNGCINGWLRWVICLILGGFGSAVICVGLSDVDGLVVTILKVYDVFSALKRIDGSMNFTSKSPSQFGFLKIRIFSDLTSPNHGEAVQVL